MKINYNKKTLFAILCMLVAIFILFEPIIFKPIKSIVNKRILIYA